MTWLFMTTVLYSSEAIFLS